MQPKFTTYILLPCFASRANRCLVEILYNNGLRQSQCFLYQTFWFHLGSYDWSTRVTQTRLQMRMKTQTLTKEFERQCAGTKRKYQRSELGISISLR